MIKTGLLTLPFLFLYLDIKAQDLPIDPETKLITYTEVVETPGVAKNDLYLRAHTWFTRAFKSAKSVLELQDKDAGKLIGKGLLPVTVKVPMIGIVDAGTVSTMVTILVKDGKYKYVVDNLTHAQPYGANTQYWVSAGPLEQEKPKVGMMGRPSKREWSQIKEDTDKTIKSMLADLKKSMSKTDADF